MNILYTVNPSRRSRRKGAKRRGRSAAQRAATRRMLAANRAMHTNPRRRIHRMGRRMRRNPSVKHHARRARRHFSRAVSSVRSAGIVGMLKNGLVGGVGAVAVDIGMGFAAKFLPTTFVTPTNTDGTANYMYLGTKAALAIALGTYGRKLPGIGRYAAQMSEGALTILAYRLVAPIAANTFTLGAYAQAAPTQRIGKSPALNGIGAYATGHTGGNRGSQTAQMLQAVGARRNPRAMR